MFSQKSVFPLKNLFLMPKCCTVCRQKMEIELGFYYGTGYVSYGLAIAASVALLVAYWTIFGISVMDNSLFYYLAVDITLVCLAMPWLIRYSRVIYLYMFVSYQSNKYLCKVTNEG